MATKDPNLIGDILKAYEHETGLEKQESRSRTGEDPIRKTCGHVTRGKDPCEGVVIVAIQDAPCNINCPLCGRLMCVPAPPACHLCIWSTGHRDLGTPEYEDLYLCLQAPDLSKIANKIVTIRAVKSYDLCAFYEDLGCKTFDIFLME